MITFTQKTVFRLVTVLAVCVFILANLSVGKLVNFLGLTIDFTGERLYSLSDDTKNAIPALQSETAIYVISAEEAYPPILQEFLKRYGILSPRISIRFVDPYADPVFLDNYIKQGYTLKEFDLLVEGAEGTRHIPAGDILRYDSGGRPTSLFLEEKLTNALVYVNTGRVFSVSFTVGHGEDPAVLKETFSGSGFSTGNLALVTGEVPGADLIVIAGPERDFPVKEIAALDEYLESGGRLMILMGPSDHRLDELETFLSSWGFSLLPGVVQESLAHIPGNPAGIIPLYGAHEINMHFAERQYYLAMPRTRPVLPAVEPAEDPDIRTTRLLLSTRDSYLASGRSGPTGPFVLAAVAQKTKGTVILFGSAAIYASDIMDTPAYANREYLVRTALWLSGGHEQDLISIPPKTLTPPRINAGFGLTLAALLFFGAILPFAVLAAGIVTLYRRRRR